MFAPADILIVELHLVAFVQIMNFVVIITDCKFSEGVVFMCNGNCMETDKNIEARFLLDMDSLCYGCRYFNGGEDGCSTPNICVMGSMNGYRMDG